MDHMMPKMDGIEATKIIRGMGYKKAIIALTANALVGRAEMFLRNGFDGFISKPIDSRELNLFLNDFIRNKKPPEVVEAARREQVLSGKLSHNAEEAGAVNPAASSQMKELFIKDAQNTINTLGEIFDKIQDNGRDDLNLYIVCVHGMKSTLANIGEMELSAAALRLELAGEDRDLETIKNDTPAFIGSLKSLIEKYKPEETSAVDEISKVDSEYLLAKLNIIKTACAAFDRNTAKNALHDLKIKSWPLPVNTLLDEISINILHSAFKRIEAMIEEYLKSQQR